MASALQAKSLEPMLLLRRNLSCRGLAEFLEASDAWDELVRCNVCHSPEKITVEAVRTHLIEEVWEKSDGVVLHVSG